MRLGDDGGWLVNAMHRPFYRLQKSSGSHCTGGSVFLWPVWTGVEKIKSVSLTGVRTQNRPDCRESSDVVNI